MGWVGQGQHLFWWRILLCKIRNSEAKKERSKKTARIPPQTPPAGGKSAEARRIHSPRQIVSPRRVQISFQDFRQKMFELRSKTPPDFTFCEIKILHIYKTFICSIFPQF
jgi:hypothetical protein